MPDFNLPPGTTVADIEAAQEELAHAVYTFSRHWDTYLVAVRSGQVLEIDRAMYWYWLEVLPPVFMHVERWAGGRRRQIAFGFAEGEEPIVYFWREDGRYFCQRSDEYPPTI